MSKESATTQKDTNFPDSMELYQAFFEQTSNGIFIADKEGIFLEINQQLCDMLHYTKDEMRPLSMRDIILEEDMVHFTQKSETSGEETKHREQCHLRNSIGEIMVVDLRVRTLANGYLLGLVHDLGKRSLIEKQFYESEERFRLLSESSLTGIYLIQDGCFSYVNQAFASMFGYEVEEVLQNLKMTDLIYPEDHALVLDNVRRRVEGEEHSIRYVFRGLCKNSSIIYVEVHGRRIQYGGKTGVIGTLIDITETKRIEEDLRILNEELEARIKERTLELEESYRELKLAHTTLLQKEKMASIGQLAAGIAHEINTPVQFVSDNIAFIRESLEDLLLGLQSCQQIAMSVNSRTLIDDVRNNLKAILEDTELDYLKEELPLAFEASIEGIRRISSIVAAMKDFAHPGGDKLAPVDLGNLINTTAEVSRNAWKQVAELTIEPTQTPLIVDGLRDELGQVVLNLITNAADAIAEVQKEGELGRIRILTRVLEGNWAEIVVEDSGCGIPEELQYKIFEPFFTTKAVGRGIGQGLAIAYHIVRDKHGGELLVDSLPGKGSTFSIRLPM